jgi:twitching motility protein PilI
MTTKETLREFQSRLSRRLQAAQTTGVTASWLAVHAGQRALLFPLSHAGEIFPWTPARHVPYVKPWFLGVANLRGGLFGVIDLAAFLSTDVLADQVSPPTRRSDAELTQCRLVALNPLLEARCALLVDQLAGLRTPDTFTRSDPCAAGAPDYYGHVYVDGEGRQWQEINLQRLAGNPAFLGISN